jgi:integrase
VTVSLGSILAEAQCRGLMIRNAVHELSRSRSRRGDKIERRQKARLQYGVDIQTREEVRAIVDAATGRWRPLLLTALFAGLRASELRGLRWSDIDLEAKLLHIRQRADRYNDIGRPKSEAGERAVPIPSILVNTLKE